MFLRYCLQSTDRARTSYHHRIQSSSILRHLDQFQFSPALPLLQRYYSILQVGFFLEIWSAGLLYRLCIPFMTLLHRLDPSVFNLHSHFTISDKLSAFREPNPRPSASLGAVTFSHDTQLIFFLSIDPPHRNLLLVLSIFLMTPAGATNNEK